MNAIDKKWWVLIGTSMAMMMVTVDFTIVNTSLANIQRDFQASVIQLQWVMAGFGILFSTMVITMGRLCDIKGRRKFLYSGIIGFALASLGAGLSTSIQFLIAMRILQGLCGAAIFPSGMAITSAAFPQEQQGKALGIYGSVIGIGLAVGPVLGSLIITFLSWRWIFFINLPVVALTLIICFPTVSESKHPHAMKVDWFGVIGITLFLSALVFAITEGPYYGWLSPIILGGFLISLLALISFIITERRTNNPVLPAQLFINRGCLLGSAVYFATISMNWAVLFIIPLYLHNQLDLTTGKVGLLLFPMTIMTVIVPFISGHWLDKHNPMSIIHLPFVLSIVSVFLFTFFNPHGPIWLIVVAFILYGSAWGIANGITIPIALSQLPNAHDHGLVSGGVVTLMNVFGVMIFPMVVLMLHYGQKVSFIHGFRMACFALLIVPVFFWIMTIIVLISKKRS